MIQFDSRIQNNTIPVKSSGENQQKFGGSTGKNDWVGLPLPGATLRLPPP